MSAPASATVALQWDRFILELAPAAGGSVARFTRNNEPLFRTCTPAARRGYEPLALAGFPLLPFASRIVGNGFEWQGRRVSPTPNMPGEPFAIHGQGWRQPWDLVTLNERSCRLGMTHPANGCAEGSAEFSKDGTGWPWHYRAEQLFEVHEVGFRLTLTLTNLADSAMPGGLGWHPYLHRGDAQLTARTGGRIRGMGDSDGARRIPHDGFSAAAVEGLSVDHGFYGWDGSAGIRWPARDISLTISASPPLSFLVIYTPPGKDYFCVEPVSHLPDAANWQDDQSNGWRGIGPGATLHATVDVRVHG